MSVSSAGRRLAADHAERALHRAHDMAQQTEERLAALIEASWWLGAGWEAAGSPDDQSLLLGFWWIRNRSIHDVSILVRHPGGYAGGYQGGYGGSPSPITRGSKDYSDTHKSEVWGSADDIAMFLTGTDKTREDAREAYESLLAGQPVENTIVLAVSRLRGRTDSEPRRT